MSLADPATSLLGISPGEMTAYVHAKLSTWTLTAASFGMDTLENPKSPPAGERTSES